MNRTERQEQIVVVQYLKLKHPDVVFFAIPNGGYRNKIEAANMKKEGVTAGIPDLFIARPFSYGSEKCVCGLFIEMKSKKGRLSVPQIDKIDRLQYEGYRCEVCYSADEAIRIIDEYLS